MPTKYKTISVLMIQNYYLPFPYFIFILGVAQVLILSSHSKNHQKFTQHSCTILASCSGYSGYESSFSSVHESFGSPTDRCHFFPKQYKACDIYDKRLFYFAFYKICLYMCKISNQLQTCIVKYNKRPCINVIVPAVFVLQ